MRTIVIGLGAVLVAVVAAVIMLYGRDDSATRSTPPPLTELGTALAAPTVDYSGNLEITAGVLALAGPVHYTPAMESRALQLRGVPMPAKTIITRRAEKLVWIIDPATKSYLKAPLASARGSADSLIAGTIADSTKLGDEAIDGFDVARFRVTFEEVDDTRLSGEIWITGDNIVLRVEGEIEQGDRTTPIVMRLSNLVIGPQAPELFEPPEDYAYVAASHPTLGITAAPSGPTDATASEPHN
ncbi:MAG: DUF4412 domain-containing protein [Alphaproteobacteria bacterium]|nr:DUF4412 domain-containing protein [Alphaproteobacteria bacterium]